jgi:glutamate-1-semialdehyde 2,1-aminomutase
MSTATTSAVASLGTQEALWDRARAVIPRGASSGHRVGWDQVLVRASGAHVWDAEGARYVDYLLAWGPIVLGHCDPRVNEAVAKAMGTCDLTGIGPQLGEIEVAEIICEVMPCADRVAFCTSGTDATMHAAHLARAATGRRKIIKFHGAYTRLERRGGRGQCAGRLHARLADAELPMAAACIRDSLGDVILVEWNDAAGVRAAFAEHGPQVAALITEPYIHQLRLRAR